MQQVILALIPGIIVATWMLGWGVFIHCCLAVVCALICEAIMLKIRRQPLALFLFDRSVVITGLLFALTITPYAPWWITCIGIFFAVAVCKHSYGGLGHNLFNPAMAGYVFVLIGFSAEMNVWPPFDQSNSLLTSFKIIFSGLTPEQVDSLSGATPLTFAQTQIGSMVMLSEVTENPLFGHWGGQNWEWIGVAFLAGGCWLLWKKIIQWQIPITMLLVLITCGLIFHHADPERYMSPLFHLFTGGTLLAAFFIATDPVTSATTARGKIIYAAGIGLLVYAIRTWGDHPDGIAFAVLTMNAAVPLIDSLTQPRIFGATDGEIRH